MLKHGQRGHKPQIKIHHELLAKIYQVIIKMLAFKLTAILEITGLAPSQVVTVEMSILAGFTAVVNPQCACMRGL